MSDKSKNTNGAAPLPAPIAKQEGQNGGWLAAITPQNAARVIKGIGHIFGKASKYSNTLSQTARENRARDTISNAVADRIASGIASSDPQFERAFEREADRLLREQTNLDDVAEVAAEHLSKKTADDFQPGEIEDDWLYQFEQAAKGFSSDRMKHTFARILSGEILRPGTFSPSTLRAITTLSAQDAQLISVYVSMAFTPTIGVLTPQLLTAELEPGSNDLLRFGLNYDSLTRLHHCGFLNYSLDTHRTVSEALFTKVPAYIGSRFVICHPMDPPDNNRQIKVRGLLVTAVGAEICQVVDKISPPDSYLDLLKSYFASAHRLQLMHT